jgi:hypothetical protein
MLEPPTNRLAHIAGLVRASIPPMHPSGLPVVACVAAVAALTRAVTGRGALLGLPPSSGCHPSRCRG